MCLAAPSLVIEVGDGVAITECFGQTRTVSLLLMSENIQVGDYLLIQAGGFAFERIEPAQALEALAMMQDLMTQPDDARRWGTTQEASK
jgi:hydrogenase expression/formation protein HypC